MKYPIFAREQFCGPGSLVVMVTSCICGRSVTNSSPSATKDTTRRGADTHYICRGSKSSRWSGGHSSLKVRSRTRGESVVGLSPGVIEDLPCSTMHVKFVEAQCPFLVMVVRRGTASSSIVLIT
ncbi:hypothetical protein TNCV_1124371 [Trichonephila clavipes]|uniref:Uncharacterized protein n=1 Tax=Trichonephila clavipes TaxID=2585209 RepID=A0A8X6SGC3_TRICX|nr:hypothetical protein TNCV_1124371 [Trichonephila clavipes]